MHAQRHVGCDLKGAMHGLYVTWKAVVIFGVRPHERTPRRVPTRYTLYSSHFARFIRGIVRVELDSVSMTCMIAAV